MDLKKCKTCGNRKGPGAYSSCMNCINDSNYSPVLTDDKSADLDIKNAVASQMNREILFRGKHTHALPQNKHLDRTWVYGYLCDENYINSPELEGEFLIAPETICQYTGLTDKNGRKIFEGDIVKFKHGGEFHDRGVWYRNYVIEYVNTFHTYGLRFRNQSIHFACKKSIISMHDVEVIGNIFDNPELLEVGE